MNSRIIRISVPLPNILFGDNDGELDFFELGWAYRVLCGQSEIPPTGRDNVPNANQNQRISWEIGWSAADLVCGKFCIE